MLSTKARSVQSNGEDVLAIDPGAGGAICRLSETSVRVSPMPDTERDVWEMIQASKKVKVALIEKVHSMPGQGVASTFKFGQNYGFLRACLIAAEIPFREITPQQWTKKYLPQRKREKAERKRDLKAAAQQLFPKMKITLKTADALLLAHYARNYLT